MKHVISFLLSFLLTFNGVLAAGLSSGPQATDRDLCDAISKLQISGQGHSSTHQPQESEDKITTVVEFCALKKADTIAYYLSCLPTPIRSLSAVRAELESAFDKVAYEYIQKEKEQTDSAGTLDAFKDAALNVMDQTLAELLPRYCPELKGHTALDIKAPHSKANPGWFANVMEKIKDRANTSARTVFNVINSPEFGIAVFAITFTALLFYGFLLYRDHAEGLPLATTIFNLQDNFLKTFVRKAESVRFYNTTFNEGPIPTFAHAHVHALPTPHAVHEGRGFQALSFDGDQGGLVRITTAMVSWLKQDTTFMTTLGTLAFNLRNNRCSQDGALEALISRAQSLFRQRRGELEEHTTCALGIDDHTVHILSCQPAALQPIEPGCGHSNVTYPAGANGLLQAEFSNKLPDRAQSNIKSMGVAANGGNYTPPPRTVTVPQPDTHTASLKAPPSPSGTHSATPALEDTDTDELTESMSRLSVSKSTTNPLEISPPPAAVSPTPHYVYWATDGEQATIYRAEINATDGTAIAPHPWAMGVNSPLSFSIDSVNGRLYVGGTSLDVFRMTNATPTTLSGKVTLLNASVSPVRFFLDLAARTLYSLRSNIITQSGVDLANPVALRNSSNFLQTSGAAYGAFVDAVNSRIYLAEGNRLKVGRLVAGKMFWESPIELHSTTGPIKGLYL